MPREKTKKYSDRHLVELIGGGEHTYREIGMLVGLSAAHVAKIAQGRRRPQLQGRIRRAREARGDLLLELGARWLGPLLTRHAVEGLTRSGDVGRRCRELVMKVLGFWGAGAGRGGRGRRSL